MITKSTVLFLIVAAQACPAAGATVIYRLRLEVDGPKTYRVTVAVVGDDNAGLQNYSVGVSGSGFTVEHVSPYTYEGCKDDQCAPAGFVPRFTEEAPGAFFGGIQQVHPLLEPQSIPLYNLGKAAGSFAAQGISPSATLHFPVWDAELVVGKGTYSSVPPQLVAPRRHRDATGNVFDNTTSLQYRKAEIILYGVPEPSGYALVGITLLALLVRQSYLEWSAVMRGHAVLTAAYSRK
jgi:hypothetical protein